MLRTLFIVSLLFSLVLGQTKADQKLSETDKLEQKGDLAFSAKDYDEALVIYEAYTSKNEKEKKGNVTINFARLQTKIGKSHYLKEDPLTAQLYFEWALDIYTHEKNPEIYSLEIARLYALSGLPQPAVDWIKSAFKQNSNVLTSISEDQDFKNVCKLKSYKDFVASLDKSNKTKLSSN